jgi:hypothetical protein
MSAVGEKMTPDKSVLHHMLAEDRPSHLSRQPSPGSDGIRDGVQVGAMRAERSDSPDPDRVAVVHVAMPLRVNDGLVRGDEPEGHHGEPKPIQPTVNTAVTGLTGPASCGAAPPNDVPILKQLESEASCTPA